MFQTGLACLLQPIMKLRDTLLLAAAFGSFMLWILEFRRASFVDSYWLLLLSLAFLLGFQYFRIRQRETDKLISPTIKQMATDRQTKKGVTPSAGSKKKK